jgi:hypothetical protein
MLGNIRFIGELFKLKMVPVSLIQNCIQKLLNSKDEGNIEQLCNLLTNIGPILDDSKSRDMMDDYMKSLKNLISLPISNRTRFMVQDIISLRENKWSSITKGVEEKKEVIALNTSSVKNMFEEFFESEELETLTYGFEQDFNVEQHVDVFATAITMFSSSMDKVKKIVQVLKENGKDLSFEKEDINSVAKSLLDKLPSDYLDNPKLVDVLGYILSEISPDQSFVMWKEFQDLKSTELHDKVLKGYTSRSNNSNIYVTNNKNVTINHDQQSNICATNNKNVTINQIIKPKIVVKSNLCMEKNKDVIIKRGKEIPSDLKVFVKYLPLNTQRSDLNSIFKGLGKLSIFMMNDKNTKLFRGMAIITFEHKKFASQALDLDGYNFKGKILSVEPCQ